VGVQPAHTISSSNLIAIIGMTVSGLGISYLPKDCLEEMVHAGHLAALKATPALLRRDVQGRATQPLAVLDRHAGAGGLRFHPDVSDGSIGLIARYGQALPRACAGEVK
jgi:hypothetical protein